MSRGTIVLRVDRVRALLRERDMNPSQMAYAIGEKQPTISRLMSGQRRPRTDILAKIARHFGVTADYLLGLSNFRYPAGWSKRGDPEISALLDEHALIKALKPPQREAYLTIKNAAMDLLASAGVRKARQITAASAPKSWRRHS